MNQILSTRHLILVPPGFAGNTDQPIKFDMTNTLEFWVGFKGFSTGSLVGEETKKYQGKFIFRDRINGKQLLEVPYTLQVNGLNK